MDELVGVLDRVPVSVPDPDKLGVSLGDSDCDAVRVAVPVPLPECVLEEEAVDVALGDPLCEGVPVALVVIVPDPLPERVLDGDAPTESVCVSVAPWVDDSDGELVCDGLSVRTCDAVRVDEEVEAGVPDALGVASPVAEGEEETLGEDDCDALPELVLLADGV